LLFILILLLISIGSKQGQEQEQEQEADLDLSLFSEQNSRFSEFSQSFVSELASVELGCKPSCLSFSRKVSRDNPNQRAALA
jgi:hypothetical protein